MRSTASRGVSDDAEIPEYARGEVRQSRGLVIADRNSAAERGKRDVVERPASSISETFLGPASISLMHDVFVVREVVVVGARTDRADPAPRSRLVVAS